MPDDVEAFLRGPLACAALLAAQDWGLSAKEVTKPGVSFALAVAARQAIDPWDEHYSATLDCALQRREEVRAFADAVLREPGVAWWSSPVADHWQVHVAGHPSDSANLVSSSYAQLPIPALVTSSYIDGDTCWDALASAHVGDAEPNSSPTRTLLHSDSSSRVFEIDSADSWHELVTRYPLRAAAAERGGLAPDWQSVAQDWDGVHLSLMGFLAGTHVPVGMGADRTVLWTWDSEQTYWLRDVFTATSTVSAAAHAARPQHDRRPLRLLDHQRDSHSRGPLEPGL
ncbi:hypothetical protein GCM10009676_07160 [Prauserella halophila]|uniref:Uncharacterized protein n=1 Tax=Prauserella halophila TaxID=185641 RepID=A0ABN1W1P4_9PSEU|nr:hypothetical protein [Prauserella halophila]MCP2237232.1 hypothetical protein [Prauserella halophila]